MIEEGAVRGGSTEDRNESGRRGESDFRAASPSPVTRFFDVSRAGILIPFRFLWVFQWVYSL